MQESSEEPAGRLRMRLGCAPPHSPACAAGVRQPAPPLPPPAPLRRPRARCTAAARRPPAGPPPPAAPRCTDAPSGCAALRGGGLLAGGPLAPPGTAGQTAAAAAARGRSEGLSRRSQVAAGGADAAVVRRPRTAGSRRDVLRSPCAAVPFAKGASGEQKWRQSWRMDHMAPAR